MEFIAIDIETGPTNDEQVIKRLISRISPPKNYRDEEKIAQYVQEKAASVVADTALNPLYGKVASFAWFTDNMEAPQVLAIDEHTEEEIILSALKIIANFRQNYLNAAAITGHNVIGFDLPYIFRRAALLGVTAKPMPIPRPDEPAWRLDYVYDTMLRWGKPWPRLKELAGMLGLLTGDEDELDGGGALDALLAGDMEKVKEHNRNDVAVSLKVAQALAEAGF